MTPRPRHALIAAALFASACSSASSPGPAAGPTTPVEPGAPAPPAAPASPQTTSSPPPTEAPPIATVTPTPPDDGPVVVGSGSGRNALDGSASGSDAILVSVDRGLYVMDPVLANEPRLQGDVYVAVNGATPPDGTTVEINGIPLVRRGLPGSPESPFSLDVAGPQPEPDDDGMVNITVRSGALVKRVSLPCPPDLAVTTSAAPDSHLRGRGSLQLSWDGDLEVNSENPFPTAFTTSAKLMHYRYATHAVGDEHYATKYVAAGAHSVTLDVEPSDDGYCAELRWQGRFFQDGGSRGFCGRAKRIEYYY